MKRISLKSLNLKEVEQLSRNQLKDVIGGHVMTSAQSCSNNCYNGSGGSTTVSHTCSGEESCVAVAGDAIYCNGVRAKSC